MDPEEKHPEILEFHTENGRSGIEPSGIQTEPPGFRAACGRFPEEPGRIRHALPGIAAHLPSRNPKPPENTRAVRKIKLDKNAIVLAIAGRCLRLPCRN